MKRERLVLGMWLLLVTSYTAGRAALAENLVGKPQHPTADERAVSADAISPAAATPDKAKGWYRPHIVDRGSRRIVSPSHTRNSVARTPANQKREVAGSGAAAQTGPSASRAATNRASIRRESASSRQAVRGAAMLPTDASSGNIRHRGSNAAVIGGGMYSKLGDAGTLSGAGVHRKP